MPETLHTLRGSVLQAQVLGQSIHGGDRLGLGPLPLQPGGDAVIGELRVTADTRPIDVGGLDRAIAGQYHLDDDGEALLVCIERREVGGKLLGEHGEDLGGRVDRGRVVAGVVVDGRPFFDQRFHVGHGNQDLHLVIGQRLGNGELIQVKRVIVVDGSP